MAYDGRIMRRALQQFEEDKQRRAAQRSARRQRICREIPRLEEIETELRGTMGRIMTEALGRGEDPAPALSRIRAENIRLQRERAQLLTDHGYPADAWEDRPRCVLCGDTGYCGGRVCACLRKYYAQEQIRSLSSLLDVGSQSFDTFELDWYDTEPGEFSRSPRETMERNLAVCRRFAEGFGREGGSLLLFGDRAWGRHFYPRASQGWSARTASPWCMTRRDMYSPGARRPSSGPRRSRRRQRMCGGLRRAIC